MKEPRLTPARKSRISHRRGVTLIMVAAVLAILAGLATGFYTLALAQTKSATRYSDSVRADMMAQAGMQFAISRMRELAISKNEDPGDPWFAFDYLNGGKRTISFPEDLSTNGIDDDGDGKVDNVEEKKMGFSKSLGSSAGTNTDRYQLQVSDAASKININAGDNLAVLLDNLCRVIGPPLVCADLDALEPRMWSMQGFNGGGGVPADYANDKNKDDSETNRDLYFQIYSASGKVMPLTDGSGKVVPASEGRPKLRTDGTALYGDGYAIAGYRARMGRFKSLRDVKNALTYVERSSPLNTVADDPLEQLEVEVKFQAIRDYITVDSWVDTNTVCTGKFEWVTNTGGSGGSGSANIAIDRDKCWMPDDLVNDPRNERGSLRGSYVSIINGHGAGQLRRIETNGIDWIQVNPPFAVAPGPISSYMIVAREDALLVDENGAEVKKPAPGQLVFPKTDNLGNLQDDPDIDYSRYPLCIHRAPINVNTASDKVLAAMFLGVNLQHGHPMSVGTDVDLKKTADAWKRVDNHKMEGYLLTPVGLKRLPQSNGKPILNRPKPWVTADAAKFDYIVADGNVANLPNFVPDKQVSEAHELAYRIIMARTRTKAVGVADPDPTTADPGDGLPPHDKAIAGFERGPFKSWDDLFFRVIKPWDDLRSGYFLVGKATIPNAGTSPVASVGYEQASVGRMLMAMLNSNTDMLKFNPNIEWIDRWGRNFTEMEAVMAYTNDAPDLNGMPQPRWKNPKVADPLTADSQPIFSGDSIDNNVRGTQYLHPAGIDNNSPDAGVYITRTYRYKSDEMIDKTDLNRWTTEATFDSRGIYEIFSVGQVSKKGEVLAERKYEALVQLYEVWRESTQRQFVQGVISPGAKGMGVMTGTTDGAFTGQIARDSVNVDKNLPITTLPEPLVPVQYRMNKKFGLKNTEEVDRDHQMRDAWGNPKTDPTMPDVLANHILPANYDGQLVLATNTNTFLPENKDERDTFLASFNGDLDTDTAIGNGREQAKVPHTKNSDGDRFRVVDTCSLLGILNDTLIDFDTDLPESPNGWKWPPVESNLGYWGGDDESFAGAAAGVPRVYRFMALTDCLKALNVNNYWENVTLRVGDLRPDGVYLSGPSTTGNDSTLKYMFGDGQTPCQDKTIDPDDAVTMTGVARAKLNFNPGSKYGNVITMWIKPTWHQNDRRTHTLFDATNPGCFQGGTSCRAFYLKKHGRTVWALGWDSDSYVSGNDRRVDDLNFTVEGNEALDQNDGVRDKDYLSNLHGGTNWVDVTKIAPNAPTNGEYVENPRYRIQPFRWSCVGMRWKWGALPGIGGRGGHWRTDDDDPSNITRIRSFARPFVNTQTFPELISGATKDTIQKAYWSSLPNAANGFTQPSDTGDTGPVNGKQDGGKGFGVTGQPIKWIWADPAGKEDPLRKSFGVNNLNRDMYTWMYHHLPSDGSYTMIDELKISSAEHVMRDENGWAKDRGVREQNTSRYFFPPDADTRAGCPTFTSQSLLQSMKGFNANAATAEYVNVARVTWTVFTPRFMHEYKDPHYKRGERTWGKTENNEFKGPFDYDKYNETYSVIIPPNQIAPLFPYGVDRPTITDYKNEQPHATKGVEVELLNYGTVIPGSAEATPGKEDFAASSGTFVNPDAMNRFVDVKGQPIASARVRTDQLQYRVRFRYPVDQLVDAGSKIDPANMYLLDTPVFDDISIVYFTTPRILDFKEVME